MLIRLGPRTSWKSSYLGRDQLVLDLSRADVRDNLFEQLCGILDQAHIEYVKWDYNRCITDAYSRTTTDQAKCSTTI